MKSNTAERLKEILRIRNLRQVDVLNLAKPFCEQFGSKLSKSDLSQYVSGKVIPGQDKLSILGNALNVSEAWLMGYDVPMERDTEAVLKSSAEESVYQKRFSLLSKEQKERLLRIADEVAPSNLLPMPKFVQKPRLGTIACGRPILAVEEADQFDMVPENIQCYFTLKCKGDSMINARIYDGDIVYIRSQREVENGEIAAVRVGDEATLKRVYYNGQRVILRACNPLYQDMEFEGEELDTVQVLGKAIAFTSMVQNNL